MKTKNTLYYIGVDLAIAESIPEHRLTPESYHEFENALIQSLYSDKNKKTCTALVTTMRTGRWVMWVDNDLDQDEGILCDRCAANLQALWDAIGVEYNIESVPWYYGCRWCGEGKSNDIFHRFKFLLEEVL